MSCAKTGLTDRDAVRVVCWGGPKEACIRWGAQWHHLANMIESFVCSGDVALCQITVSTRCYYGVEMVWVTPMRTTLTSPLCELVAVSKYMQAVKLCCK